MVAKLKWSGCVASAVRCLGYYPDEEEENINNYVDEDYFPEEYDQDLGYSTTTFIDVWLVIC